MGCKPHNVFLKIASLKQKLMPSIDGLTDKRIKNILCHCSYFACGRRKGLDAKEREVYDILLRYKISPKTVYQWFSLIDAPDHIKQKMKQQGLTYTEAVSRSYAWKRMTGGRNSMLIMNEVRKIIGGLEWKNKNQTL